jgi:hypothetical protein
VSIQATRTEMLIRQFEAACGELRDTIAGVPDEKWQAPTAGDGRQVNVVAHHAASSHEPIARQIQAVVDGQPKPLTMDQIHAGNAEHARAFAACTRSETLELHDRGVEEAGRILRGLHDEQLAREGEFLTGMPATVEQAVQRVLIGHPREHTATIQATLSH